MKKTPIAVFGSWAESGRDEDMAAGHLPAVEHMLGIAVKGLQSFGFIDAGCGNGWVVRKVSELTECISATGVDGAQKMIEKAQSIDTNSRYVCTDLMQWQPETAVDLVHSMEVFYYLSQPDLLIENIYKHWLKEHGRLIIGIDFYEENTASHAWPEDCGIAGMKRYSEATWVGFFERAGFRDVRSWRFGAKKGWAGTLVIMGTKEK